MKELASLLRWAANRLDPEHARTTWHITPANWHITPANTSTGSDTANITWTYKGETK